ncbi:MAG: 3-phosphoglycerate dehydrogenase [Chitinivibrionales bacterium]|nr:3-phosphoglycerate dehydrogenase [Chitinivibrionales bacterium]
MFKIQTLNKISNTGLDLFPREDYEIASEILNPDAILLRSFKMHDMELPPSLKAVARAGAGVNNIPIDKCSQQGIVVFNTPGANANGVKELTITGLFLASRGIVDGIMWAKSLVGKGADVPKLIEKNKSNYAGGEIVGKKLGVVGLGAIGVSVANAAIALGMEVTGYDPSISVEAAWGLSRSVQRASSLESLLAESDFVTLHVPLLEKTKGMINRDKFVLMKKGVCILNFARGGLVNNEDLKQAINDGIVDVYITDFPDEELLKMDKVIPVPHLGASTQEAEDNCAVMAVNQLRNYLEHGTLKNSVNFPDCQLQRTASKRIVIGNENVPAMVGQITAVLAEEKINIAEMLNRSKGKLAYNIIDFEGELSEQSMEKIRKIDGLIMARVL